MIDRNRGLEAQEVQTHVIHTITSGILLDNLLVRSRSARAATASAGRALISLQDSGLDLSRYSREYGALFNIAGRAAYSERDYYAAKDALAEAAKLRPTDVDSRLRLGILCICTGDPKEAERALYGASIASIIHLEGINALAEICTNNGRPSTGLAQASADIAERTANILYALGESRLAQGKYGPAARAFEKCLTFDPQFDGVDERLKIAYESLAQRRFTN